jgi:hypothetical protein
MSPDLRFNSATIAALFCAESGPRAFSNLAACRGVALVSGRRYQAASAGSSSEQGGKPLPAAHSFPRIPAINIEDPS